MKIRHVLPVYCLLGQVGTGLADTDLIAPSVPRVGEYYTFQASLADKLGIHGTRSYLDRHGWQTQVGWAYNQERLDYEFNDKVNSTGRSLFKRTLVNSLRETAAHLPVTEGWQMWAENLYVGLLGNTAEESIKPDSITPSPQKSVGGKSKKIMVVSHMVSVSTDQVHMHPFVLDAT